MSSRNGSSGSSSDIDSADSDAVDSFHHPEGELDADAPRIVQWEAEDDQQACHSENPASAESDGAQTDKIKSRSAGKQLKPDGISGIPFGTLLKTRRMLDHDHKDYPSSAGESSSTSHSDVEDGRDNVDSGKQKNAEWETKPRRALDKRPNKHAPTEMSSKRPVTRRRVVVESKEVHPRDPRFLPLTGELSTSAFQSQYGFLSDMHKGELATLKENYKRAKKLLVNSPKHLRMERGEEVNKLELAVKRAESLVNRDRREAVERTALERVAKEEKEKRKSGKAGYWMKDSAKKDLLLRARYDDLAASGGKTAIKKAVEKRQKKVHQKEKKSRPAGASAGRGRDGHERPVKRRKVDT